MPLFLLKSILAIPLFLSALVAAITMFEVYGRTQKPANPARLVRIHRINAVVFLLLFLVLSYLCVKFLVDTKTDLGPRAALHSVFSLAVFALLVFKVAVATRYRGFYAKLPAAGLGLAVLTFLMIGSSAGYLLLVTDLGKEQKVSRVLERKEPLKPEASRALVRTDPETIAKGKGLFGAKCASCHYAASERRLTGPGLKSVLRHATLPVSGKPATPENILVQLRAPYMLMPSFGHLSEQDTQGIIAYLKTL